MLEKVSKYRPSNANCVSCGTEKRYNLIADPKYNINKRDELYAKCRHQNKFKICDLKRNDSINPKKA